MADKKKPEINFSMNHPKVDVPNYGSVPVQKSFTDVYQPAQQNLTQAQRANIAAAINDWLRKQKR